VARGQFRPVAWIDLQRMPLDDAMLQGAALMFDGLMALVAVFLIFALSTCRCRPSSSRAASA
jgi:hypothetical protein